MNPTPVPRLRRTVMTRSVAATLLIAVLLLVTSPSAGAATSYSGAGVYWSGGGQCAKWTLNMSTVPEIAISAQTITGQGAYCATPLVLPSGWIMLDYVRGYWWNGASWVMTVDMWPKPATNPAGSYTAAWGMSAPLNTNRGFWYPRASHSTLQVGGFTNYVSGFASPILTY